MESQGGLPELGRWGIKSSNLNSDIVFYKKKSVFAKQCIKCKI